MLTGTAQLVPSAPVSAAAAHDYAKALQMSLYFYECQQAGHLPEWNRVEWRGDATVNDEIDGGWYDAGDHVKFNLPMSYSAAMLAWGLYEYPEAIESCGEMTNYVNNLKFVLDYFVRCDLGDSVVYQVGIGQKDHSWWGSVEVLEYGMKEQNMTGYRDILEGRNCTAVTAEMAAALAAGYCALQGRVDSATLDGYLKHAKNLLELADSDRSDAAYNKSDAMGFYQSRQFYDDLFYAANWLYMATGDNTYLTQAESYIPNLGKELGEGDALKYSWSHCWDDVQQGGTLLYAINTGKEQWVAQTKKHLDYWLKKGNKKEGGLCYVDSWGCLRYANTVGFITAVACDRLFKNDPSYSDYKKMYEDQINYTLGDNPNHIAYVVGYDETSPRNPHHRTAHGSWKNDFKMPDQSRHILYGAVVGGPDESGKYVDDRNNYINNEVATDYNAGFTALCCKMIDEYGGHNDPTFPPPETRDDEFFVEAKATHDDGGSTVSMKITNHTAWPARVVDNISMRYYMDMSELIAAGVDPTTVEMRCDRDQSEMYAGDGVKKAVISKPQKYDGNIYYIEITFPDGRAFLPVSEGQHQCEILLAIVYPGYGHGWDATNDYSAKGLGSTANEKTKYIPVYENGTLIFGEEPDGSVGTGSISARKYKAPSAQPGTTPGTTTTKPVTTTITTTTTTTPITTTTTPVTTTSDSNPGGKTNRQHALWGDVNCDDDVDVSDAVLLARFLAEDSEAIISEDGQLNSDVNHNGNPDQNDVPKILKYIAKMIPYSDLEA
ncbi:MAG TPA: glycoside hydrolase [Ruminococcus sp.]|nr:glycoside hydrolase [Ruminococcus sp.]